MTGSRSLALAGGVATILAAAGLYPVIASTDWVGLTLVAVGLVVGVGIGLRGLRAPTWVVLAGQGVSLLIWCGHLVGSDVARLGWLPSRAWAERLADTFVIGVDTVRTFSAPVQLDSGVLLLVVGGVGITALAVDALAVTARAAPLAGIPLVVVHAVAMVTTPTGPSAWAFVAAAAGYLGLLAVDGHLRARSWGRPLGSSGSASFDTDSPLTRLSSASVALGAGAVLIAVTGASALPQGGLALFGGTGGGGDGSGQTIRTENPIVDLKRDLVQPENVEVIRFTTTSEQPDYLRLLTLDVYDGTVWRASDRPVPEDQRISEPLPSPPGLSPDIARTEHRYQFEVTDNLESEWLPLPYPAQEITTSGGDWRYADTLDVVALGSTTRGLRYDVTALAVQPTPDQLRGLPPLPGQFLDLLELPDDLPLVVRDLAREVTADAVDSYDRAVALQQWFRNDGGFVYDLSVDPGNNADDLVAFLNDRRGYCEQYAATMAIMARILGIPARVAVGYLRGEEAQPGFWVVRAQDAHAWPELYFDGIGWVTFEPTPAARTGAPPDYTVPGQQTDDRPSDLDADGAAVPDEESVAPPFPLSDIGDVAGPGFTRSSAAAVSIAIAVVAVVLIALVPWVAGWVIRWRRWSSAAGDPAAEAEAAWADIEDAALEAGFAANRHDTLRTSARELAAVASLPYDAQGQLATVATATERSRFAPVAPDVEGLRDNAESVRQALLSQASRQTRWAARMWPAPVRRLVTRSRR